MRCVNKGWHKSVLERGSPLMTKIIIIPGLALSIMIWKSVSSGSFVVSVQLLPMLCCCSPKFYLCGAVL